MSLGQVAETNHNGRSEYHGGCRIPTKNIDKELQQNIVDQDTSDGHQEVPDKLYPAAQVRTREYHEHAQVKTGRESDTEGNQECCNVRTDSNGPKVKHQFVQHKIVQQEIQQDIESGIGAATCCIPKSLQGHKGLAQGIEKIHGT